MRLTNPINHGTNNSTTQDWINTTRDMNMTAYDPRRTANTDVIEPGKAVNIPAEDRARMNRAKSGVRTKQERL
jgi:hypothetical protein